MIKTFKKEFKACKIRFDQKILVAVSGGVDSMVLWDLMEKSKYLYGVAHVNFGLRGEESEADEALVEKIALQRGIPFHTKKVNTTEKANAEGISIQMAARDLRYDFFEELAATHQYDCLATAHHLEDDIETFLLNLNRGTGVKGLAGIRSTAERFRPLLSFTKEEIRNYAAEYEVMFREDKSNESINYDRNWFRHEIIAPWKGRNPSLLNIMRQNLIHIKETYDILDEFVQQQSKKLEQELHEGVIKYSTIDALKRKQFYLFHILSPLGFSSTQISSMLVCIKKNQVGKVFESGDWRIYTDRDKLDVIEGSKLELKTQLFEIVKNTTVIVDPIKLEFQRLLINEFKGIRNQYLECVDRSKLTFPLQVRKWQSGDRMQPFGMQGKKKVSDILTDLKIPRAQKDQTYVLLSEGKIVWLIGHRLDNRFKVTEESSKLLQIKFVR